VDAWFLDGFTPAKNPQMWSDLLFQNMARLSHAHTTCASFTAAGFVRRGLQAAGFDIQKTKGFAYKADMIQGLYAKGTSAPCYNIQKIAIDGAGLAGTACAFVASSYGITADLYDPNGLATQASGNPAGMVNPRISAKNDFLSNFYSQSFVQFINSLGNHLGQKVGCLHLIEDTIKDKRYRSMSQEWPWPENAAQIVNTDQASDIAGIKIDKDALWLPDSMVAAPHDVCAYWLSKSNSTLHPFSRQKDNIYDAHIDASGANMVARYAKDLPIYPVRGQLTILPENMACLDLRCNLAYGGYITPLHQGQQIVGSTFQKWVEHYNIEIDDHIENINKLQNSIPFFQYLTLNKNIKGRAGLRVASEDHLPVIGRWIPHQEAVPLYLSGAHGSHGMVSSLMAAYMILDDMLNLPRMLPRTTRQSIAPDRFYKRAQRRQGL
jgi:tRNA 5-methylaminomethyl-2-thiouridine biosynthesis bifunctional protein